MLNYASKAMNELYLSSDFYMCRQGGIETPDPSTWVELFMLFDEIHHSIGEDTF